MCFLLSWYGRFHCSGTRMRCYRLSMGLKTTPAALLASSLELGVVDGLILPHLKMNGNTDSCTYLNKNGRCSIHPFRPGSAGSFHWGVTMKIILFHIFSRLTNVQNPARQRAKSVNGIEEPDFSRHEKFVSRLALLSQTVTELCYDIRRQ